MYAWQFMQLLAHQKARPGRFVSMQNHYNLAYREEEREMLPLCRDQGIAVTPWSPLARGLLAGTAAAAPGATRPTTWPGWYDQQAMEDAIVAPCNRWPRRAACRRPRWRLPGRPAGRASPPR
jgi:aryl-alcohol dehydrogenase (NADP+)